MSWINDFLNAIDAFRKGQGFWKELTASKNSTQVSETGYLDDKLRQRLEQTHEYSETRKRSKFQLCIVKLCRNRVFRTIFVIAVLSSLTYAFRLARVSREPNPTPKEIIQNSKVMGENGGVLFGARKEFLVDTPQGSRLQEASLTNSHRELRLLVKNESGQARLSSNNVIPPGEYDLKLDFSEKRYDCIIHLIIGWEMRSEHLQDGTIFDPFSYPFFAELRTLDTSVVDSLEINPAKVDLANGSGFAFQVGQIDPQNITLIIWIEILRFSKHGGFQFALPDQLTLQIVDGALDLSSVKYGDFYVSPQGTILGRKRSDAGKVALENALELEKLYRIELIRKDGRVTLKIDGQTYSWLEPKEVPEPVLPDWSTISIRSFGSRARINRISVQ